MHPHSHINSSFITHPPQRQSLSRWLLLMVSAIASALIFEHSWLDVTISKLFYGHNQWLIAKDAQPFRFIFYDAPKTVLILMAVYLVLNLLIISVTKPPLGISQSAIAAPSRYGRWVLPLSKHELGYLIIAVLMVPATIGSLKALTHVSCPSHLLLFDGDLPYLTIWQDMLAKTPAKCFPAAHASAGFALYAFAYLPRYYRLKMRMLIMVTLLGWIMGLYKMMIGDHFFSHTLVSMWLSWGICYGIAMLFFHTQRRQFQFKTPAATHNSAHLGNCHTEP